MNETYVTLCGWLGGDVTMREAGGVPVATFRVASTPRRYQRRTDTWEDGDTQWYRVNAWRALAENCDRSLRRGDPVVVHGKLSANVWTSRAGVEMTTFEVEAAFVGHDLNRGTSAFERRKPAGAAPAVGSSEQATGEAAGTPGGEAGETPPEQSTGGGTEQPSVHAA